MIRYLAFQGQSTDRKAPSYNAEGLPLIPGLTKLVNGRVAVRSGGSWVLGSRWTPPAATPASPGWVSDPSAYASAANVVLSALTGKSFARQAAQASDSGVATGIALPADNRAGRALGAKVGQLALALAKRYAGG